MQNKEERKMDLMNWILQRNSFVKSEGRLAAEGDRTSMSNK